MNHKYLIDYLSTPTILFTSNPLTGYSSPSMEESEQGVEKLLSEYCTDIPPSNPMEGEDASFSEEEMHKIQEEFDSVTHVDFGGQKNV